MAAWVKSLVMLVFLAVWSAVVLTELSRSRLPEPLLWGMPGGLWVLLNPNFRKQPEPVEEKPSQEAAP